MPANPIAEPLRALVIANRILASQGVLDAFGHVSIRHPKETSRFFIARSLGPELVAEADLQEFTLDNQQVGGSPLPGYSERAIHAAIYAARPDVQAVCHNHSPSVIPYGVSSVRLRPIYHMAGLLGTEVPVWDPQPDFGDTDMLVRTLEQGHSLARTLGGNRVALMRGHGSVVASQSLREVVMCCVYLEHNARLQREALALGETPRYLTDGEIQRTLTWTRDPVIQERAWNTWQVRAGFPLEG